MSRFAFIGCGNISRFHAQAAMALGHQIAGAAARPGSKKLADFGQAFQFARLYEDWRRMIDDLRPDALVLAVSWDQTQEMAADVINSGIPCLIEKPVALSSSKCQDIVEQTRSFHDQVLVGYNRRFYDFVPLIEAELKTKTLLSVELNFPETARRLIEVYSPRIAPHILLYMSSHGLDLLTYLVGDVEVRWLHRQYDRELGYPKVFDGILWSLRHRVPIHLTAHFDAPSNTSLTFHFAQEIYRCCPLETLTIYEGMERIDPTPENPIRRFRPREKEVHGVDLRYKPGFLGQLEHFVQSCIQKSDIPRRGCTLEQALRVTQLCEKISREPRPAVARGETVGGQKVFP